MRFIDGLRGDIKAIVLVLRPPDLDTACTLAMLQVEANPVAPTRSSRYGDWTPSKPPIPSRLPFASPAVP
jgi:hypothetical protein